MTMRTRGSVRAAAAAAVLAALLSPVVTGSAPAAAHPGFTSRADDVNADIATDPTINGTTMNVRVLRPDTSAPSGGWPLVVYMAGDFKNRCANVNERVGTQTSWYSRKQMVEHGFAVVSFNPRGLPTNTYAGLNPSGTSGCGGQDDAVDAIDDSGWDLAGPNDKQDIDDLIEWAVANYNPNTTGDDCAVEPTPCINGGQVGLFGYGFEGARKALLMGVPLATNPQYNSRVDAIVTVGYSELTVRNLKDLSSDGAATPAFRDVDQGLRAWLPSADAGSLGLADTSVLTNMDELLRAKYLNYSVPAATTTWLDDRTVVDDNATVDKAQEIVTPVFMANAFLDNEAGIATATLAYNKLGATNKYLYIGACGSSYGQLDSTTEGPCRTTTNGPNLKDKVHAFLDRWVKGDTTATVGGPVFYAMPPATNPLSSDGWTVTSDPDAAWPPNNTTNEYCFGNDGNWYTCGTEPNDTGSISNVVASPWNGFCSGLTYGATEVKSYTSTAAGAGGAPMIGFEMDFWTTSTTTRSQFYVDVIDVDASGNETRVWQGATQMNIVPTARNVVAGTGVHWKFKPGGNGWTFAENHLIRVKIAANYKKSFAQELLPATYYLYHDPFNDGLYPMKATFTWV